MSALAAWITAIFVAVVIAIGAELLFSDTRMSKFIRSVTAIVILLVIVMPIPALVKNGFSIGGDDTAENNMQLDESFIGFVDEKRINAVEAALAGELKNAGISGAAVKITRDGNGEKTKIVQVEINLADSVIDEKLGHINMNELAVTTVCKYLNIEKSKVVVYGQKD
mgnify:FL=1